MEKSWSSSLKRSAERYPFVFHSHVASPTGYAATAAGLMRAFWEVGLDVRYLYIADDPMYEKSAGDNLVDYLKGNLGDFSMPQVVYSVAPLFWHNSGAYKIGWTMMEVDGISQDWVAACNAMNEVWVPTFLQTRYFHDSGVQVPVYRMPLGIDTSKWNPWCYPGTWHGPPGFRFLAVGWWQLRKRWDTLLRVFTKEFEDDPDVWLLCKIHTEDNEEEVKRQLETMTQGRDVSRVVVVDASLPWWALASLYRMCHVFVLPTGGEGYGLPPLEALACGLPVITTDCMGTGEVLRDDVGKPYPGVHFIAAEKAPTEVTHPYYAGSNWWVPDGNHLALQMRRAVNEYEEWRELALAGSARVREERSLLRSAWFVKRRLAEIYRQAF